MIRVIGSPVCSRFGFYCVDETVKLLGLARRTVYKLMKAGELEYFTDPKGAHRYIKGSEILRYWNEKLKPIPAKK